MIGTRAITLLASSLLATGLVAGGCGTDANSGFGDDDGGGGASGASGSNGFAPPTGDGSANSDGNASNGGPACATAEATASRQPVYLHLVLDRSRSMDGHGNKGEGDNVCDPGQTVPDETTCFLLGKREADPLDPERDIEVCHRNGEDAAEDCPNFIGLTGKKWLAARGALVSYFDTVAVANDPRLAVGMFLFDGGTNDTSPWAVAPAMVGVDQANALKTTVLPPSYPTAGGTPLRAALRSQSAALAGFTPQAPLEAGGKRVLVVMTDGAPGDCGANRNACVEDVQALVTGESAITTFVIGVGDVDDPEGSVYDERFLSRLAKAGGAAPADCNPDWNGQQPEGTQPCHFQITPGEKSSDAIRDEMVAAFTQIAAKVQSCELTLNKTSPIDPNKVNVIYTAAGGAESQIPPGENGWSYDDPNDPNKVILNGAACEQLKADPNASIRIVIGCPTGTSVVN